MKAGALLFAAAFAATAAAAAEPICADRPGKANPTCTVPAGMIQIETGLFDWDTDTTDGVRTDDLTVGQTAFKYGLTNRSHIELDITPYTAIRLSGHGARDRSASFGDLGLAYKYRLTSEGVPVQVAAYPFLKIPTARRPLGNRRIEGGAAMLVDGSVPGTSIGWNVAPEIDVNADNDGSGHHFGMVQVVSIGLPVTNRFSISSELWGAWDFDPAGTTRQFSADAAASLLVSANLQVDGGVNLGLNRNTPALELYSGVAARF